MKSFFTFMIILLGCWQAIAQPVIGPDYYPQSGQIQERVSVFPLGIAPGEAGANRTWDFTGLQLPAGATRTTYENLLPNQTPYASAFPLANVAGIITDTVELYTYYHIGSHGWVWLGVGTLFGPQVFDDPLTILQPLAFNESFRDTARASYVFEGFEYYQYIEEEVWYRAYGTLKLPQATFHNAILVETNQMEIDSFLFTEEGFYSVDTIITQIWNWMIPGVGGPIGTYDVSEGTSKLVFEGAEPEFSSFGPEYNAEFDLNTTTAFNTPQKTTLNHVSCTPNPASGTTWITLDSTDGIAHASLKLLDASSRIVRAEMIEWTEGSQGYALNLTGLSGGLYWVQLTSEEGNTQTIPLVVR